MAYSELMGNLQRAEAILQKEERYKRANWDAGDRLDAIDAQIVRTAKKQKSGYVKCIPFILPVVIVVLMPVLGLLGGFHYLLNQSDLQVTVSLQQMELVATDGAVQETYPLMQFIGEMLSYYVHWLIKGAWVGVALVTFAVYWVAAKIDWKKHQQERMERSQQEYADARREAASEVNKTYRELQRYQASAEAMWAHQYLPKKFTDLGRLYKLINIAENYRSPDLYAAISSYEQEEKEKREQEFRKQQIALAQRQAAAIEEQNRIASQRARDAERQHREQMDAAQRSLDVQKRSAKAVEELRNIEEQWDWDMNHGW